MDNLEFDDLNDTNEKTLSVDYDTYFGEMDLTDEEKEKRKKFAEELEKEIIFFFALYLIAKEIDYQDMEYAKSQLEQRYRQVIERNMEMDEHLENHISDFAQEIFDVTQNHTDDEWYTSDDRAVLTAENETNCIANYDNYRNAVKAGRKNKTWVTMNDKAVRHTHRILDYKTIPINGVFLVGDSEMLFPKDDTFGASMKEIAGCRCTIKYH